VNRLLLLRLLVGGIVGAMVVLLARLIAYASEPAPAARVLEHRAGGPSLPVLALASLALGAALAVAVCWLAAVAVRERALLEPRLLSVPVGRFRVRSVLGLALTLSLVTCVGGGLLEAYIHWRAGLGWHGLQCVSGPVHRDLLPIETALSFVAGAIVAAAEHVMGWMRRTFARLGGLVPRLWTAPAQSPSWRFDLPRGSFRVGSASARAPPASA
jgi:hypothetical protein